MRFFDRENVARTLIPGRIDDTAVAVYTAGQCHALAIALAAMTGWPAAMLAEPECRFSPTIPACSQANIESGLCGCQLDHLVVVRPTDRALIDITGAHTSAIPGLEDHRLVPMTDALWNDVLTSPEWQPPDFGLALAFAQTVLTRLHTRETTSPALATTDPPLSSPPHSKQEERAEMTTEEMLLLPMGATYEGLTVVVVVNEVPLDASVNTPGTPIAVTLTSDGRVAYVDGPCRCGETSSDVQFERWTTNGLAAFGQLCPTCRRQVLSA